jgi:hypothetical protein
MLFGGGGNKGGGGGGMGGMGNMMETIKKAQEMGVKVKELQAELVNTEVEATSADGGVTVVISGAQVRMDAKIHRDIKYASSPEGSPSLACTPNTNKGVRSERIHTHPGTEEMCKKGSAQGPRYR